MYCNPSEKSLSCSDIDLTTGRLIITSSKEMFKTQIFLKNKGIKL